MIKTTSELKDYIDTLKVIISFAEKYQTDLEQFKNTNIYKFYDIVRKLPYVADPVGVETVSRPKYLIDPNWTGPRDCDDKTLLIAAQAEQLKIPYRIIVCGQGTKPHHVYPEISLNGNWVSSDATYPRCQLGNLLYKENFRKVYSKKDIK